MADRVPDLRVHPVNDRPVRPKGAFVLYWMIAQRRRRANFALQRAVEWSRELDRPLVVLEALRCDYRWASDRLHRFVLDGMRDNARDFASGGATHHAYVEPRRGAGKGLLAALARSAAVVVTDERPGSFLPRMVAAAGAQLPVRLEQVDGNGLLPLRAADRVFARAADFRRLLQQVLPAHLCEVPSADPLRLRLPDPVPVPRAVARRWPAAPARLLDGAPEPLAALPIDHSVPPVASRPGGAAAAARRLRRFLRDRLPRYLDRSRPDADAASGLSPYLHFGHLSAHEVFAALGRRERWRPAALRRTRDGRRGWYGMSAPAEAFLDELVTWRELALNFAWQRGDMDRFASLPGWARATLDRHRDDPREHVYPLDRFEAAATHDPLWNAAQRQLLCEGVIHNHLRMLWGKKVLQWSRRPEDAWEILIALNDRYALDGRDPSSYAGIGWIFGRYDRPWGPERPVSGLVRYLSSENTGRKLGCGRYLATWGR